MQYPSFIAYKLKLWGSCKKEIPAHFERGLAAAVWNFICDVEKETHPHYNENILKFLLDRYFYRKKTAYAAALAR